MAGQYQYSFDNTQSPLNVRSGINNSAAPGRGIVGTDGKPVSYQTNVNRQKSKKWVEAKKADYGGDDWGSDEDIDEGDYEDQYHQQQQQPAATTAVNGAISPPPPPPIAKDDTRPSSGQAQLHQSQPPSSPTTQQPQPPTFVTRPRTSSLNVTDQRAQGIPMGQATRHSDSDRQPHSFNNRMSPPSLQTQVGPGLNPPSAGARTYSLTQSSGLMADSSRTRSLDSNARPGSFGRPGQHSIASSGSTGSRPESPSSGAFPPRQSSLHDDLPLPPAIPASGAEIARPGSSGSNRSSGTPSGPVRKIIRPSDIYKKLAEQQEQERRSQDTQRPSMDAINNAYQGNKSTISPPAVTAVPTKASAAPPPPPQTSTQPPSNVQPKPQGQMSPPVQGATSMPPPAIAAARPAPSPAPISAPTPIDSNAASASYQSSSRADPYGQNSHMPVVDMSSLQRSIPDSYEERQHEYGGRLETLQEMAEEKSIMSFRMDDDDAPGRTSAETSRLKSVSGSLARSVQSIQEEPKRFSKSPELPDLGFGPDSDFRASLWALPSDSRQSTYTDKTPLPGASSDSAKPKTEAIPPVPEKDSTTTALNDASEGKLAPPSELKPEDARKSLGDARSDASSATSTEETAMKHEKSVGMRSVVNQAFDNANGSTLASPTTSSAEPSPGKLSTVSESQPLLAPLATGAAVATAAELTSSELETPKPGFRRELEPPSQRDIPAKSPSLEQTALKPSASQEVLVSGPSPSTEAPINSLHTSKPEEPRKSFEQRGADELHPGHVVQKKSSVSSLNPDARITAATALRSHSVTPTSERKDEAGALSPPPPPPPKDPETRPRGLSVAKQDASANVKPGHQAEQKAGTQTKSASVIPATIISESKPPAGVGSVVGDKHVSTEQAHSSKAISAGATAAHIPGTESKSLRSKSESESASEDDVLTPAPLKAKAHTPSTSADHTRSSIISTDQTSKASSGNLPRESMYSTLLSDYDSYWASAEDESGDRASLPPTNHPVSTEPLPVNAKQQIQAEARKTEPKAALGAVIANAVESDKHAATLEQASQRSSGQSLPKSFETAPEEALKAKLTPSMAYEPETVPSYVPGADPADKKTFVPGVDSKVQPSTYIPYASKVPDAPQAPPQVPTASVRRRFSWEQNDEDRLRPGHVAQTAPKVAPVSGQPTATITDPARDRYSQGSETQAQSLQSRPQSQDPRVVSTASSSLPPASDPRTSKVESAADDDKADQATERKSHQSVQTDKSQESHSMSDLERAVLAAGGMGAVGAVGAAAVHKADAAKEKDDNQKYSDLEVAPSFEQRRAQEPAPRVYAPKEPVQQDSPPRGPAQLGSAAPVQPSRPSSDAPPGSSHGPIPSQGPGPAVQTYKPTEQQQQQQNPARQHVRMPSIDVLKLDTNSAVFNQPVAGPIPAGTKNPTFRDILSKPSTAERIQLYNSSRQQFSEMNIGLPHWIAIASANIPKDQLHHFKDTPLPIVIAAGAGKLGGTPVTPSKPYFEQYLDAMNSSPTQNGLGASQNTNQSRPNLHDGSQMGPQSSQLYHQQNSFNSSFGPGGQNAAGRSYKTQQVTLKGKDILHSANKLFAKGKNKLRSVGTERRED
jgi:hypothetical protein